MTEVRGEMKNSKGTRTVSGSVERGTVERGKGKIPVKTTRADVSVEVKSGRTSELHDGR